MPAMNPGGTLILTATSTGVGNAFRIPKNADNVTFQAVQIGTSEAATISSTTKIEVSNDGVNWLTTICTDMVITGDSPASGGLAAGVALPAGQHWEYVRAKASGYGATTAASTGALSSLNVYASATYRS